VSKEKQAGITKAKCARVTLNMQSIQMQNNATNKCSNNASNEAIDHQLTEKTQ